MVLLKNSKSNRVIVLALTSVVTVLCLFGCSATNDPHISHYDGYDLTCKTRAYINITLPDYLNTRYDSKLPIRLGIIPFSVPANLTTVSSDMPGAETKLAWKLHAELVSYDEIPIVEVLLRDDWPRKREDFFAGNFASIKLARDGGYQLVLTGFVEPLGSLNKVKAYAKVIDTETGVTVWYGETIVTAAKEGHYPLEERLGLYKEDPNQLASSALFAELAKCLTHAMMREDEIN